MDIIVTLHQAININNITVPYGLQKNGCCYLDMPRTKKIISVNERKYKAANSSKLKSNICDYIHCFICNEIICWLSIVDAFNFNIWLTACMSNYIPLFFYEVILIHVLTPVLCLQISVRKKKSCLTHTWVRHRTITCIIDGLFSFEPSGANLSDVWLNMSIFCQ